MRTVSSWFLGCLLMWPAGCSDGKLCTLIACAGPTITVTTNVDPQVTDLVVEVCLNSICEQVPGPSDTPAFTVDRDGETVRISVATQNFISEANDGDVVVVRIDDAVSGNRVTDARASVEYTEFRPNGPKCAPVCLSATIEL